MYDYPVAAVPLGNKDTRWMVHTLVVPFSERLDILVAELQTRVFPMHQSSSQYSC